MMGFVTKIAMVGGPVFLALMGVAVSVWQPKGKGAHCAWTIGFVMIGVVTIVASIGQINESDRKIDDFTKTLSQLKDAINALTKPLKEDGKSSRDPDTLYQNSAAVGRVIAPRIVLNESKIYFEEVHNAGNLDRSKPFEYRDFILRIVTAGSFVGILVTPSGVSTSVLRNVVCEIVGRTNKE